MGLHDSVDVDRWRFRARSFGAAADLYDEVRPSYPPPVFDWALGPLGPGHWRVADIGAGTGIMTRRLLAAGYDVVAVEPDDLMRERLTRTTPGALAVAGSAESVPLPDASVDAAVAGQAYHWFDRGPTHAELARVIRRGGTFTAIWNDRDESVAWAAAYSEIVDGDRGPDGRQAGSGDRTIANFGDQFGPVEVATFRHSVRHTPDSLVRLLASRSYFLTASPTRKLELEGEIRELAATHPELAGRTDFELPYVTTAFRAVRR